MFEPSSYTELFTGSTDPSHYFTKSPIPVPENRGPLLSGNAYRIFLELEAESFE